MQGESSPTPFDLGFAAGLILGEGTFTMHNTPALVISLKDDPGPLRLVQETLGGKVYGPYMKRTGTNPVPNPYYDWHLIGPALRAALPVLDSILPPGRKRVQFEAWRERFANKLRIAR